MQEGMSYRREVEAEMQRYFGRTFRLTRVLGTPSAVYNGMVVCQASGWHSLLHVMAAHEGLQNAMMAALVFGRTEDDGS